MAAGNQKLDNSKYDSIETFIEHLSSLNIQIDETNLKDNCVIFEQNQLILHTNGIIISIKLTDAEVEAFPIQLIDRANIDFDYERVGKYISNNANKLSKGAKPLG